MLDGLNDQQKEAVISSGNVLLTACPGSGKTRVLTYKVAYELQNIGSKEVVAALTFTNRAAEEIKKRVDFLDIDAGKLWAGTIHAFCLEWILYPYSGYLPELKNGFVIVDEYKVEDLLTQLKAELNLSKFTRVTTRLKSDGQFVDTNLANHELLTLYHDTLKKERLIDFDQMLYLSFKLLDTYPKIGKALNNLFKLICVDEYQDTQDLQYRILAKIISARSNHTRIFFVGDKDQAIYESLGGVAKTLQQIKVEFGNIEIQELNLSGNYRSTQRSIDYYKNFQTADIDIQSVCDYAQEQGEITLDQTTHHTDLSETISNLISINLANGIPEKEICVLAPQWWMVIPMGRKLKMLLPNVSFDAIGLSPLVKSKENIWFKFARLFLVDPAPNMYFVRSRWANELLDVLDSLGLYLFSEKERRAKCLLKAINSIKSSKDDGLEYLEECFVLLMKQMDVDVDSYPNLLIHWKYFFEGTKKRLDNVQNNYARDLKSFKALFYHKNGVVVNTCHGIKGEEFHTVICFGLLENYVPNSGESNPETAANKLLYVICSRAKKHLHLIAETGRDTHWKSFPTTYKLSDVQFTYD